QFRGSRAETQGESLRQYKAGDEVFFLAGKEDGRDVLIGLSAMNGGPRADGGRPNPSRPAFDSSALKPLTELGTGEYRGFVGGLYPQGKNERPPAHEAAGLELASQVRPLDRDGAPADDGRIVLLSLGMSNTSQLSDGFRTALQNADGVNSRFQFVNGSQGGMVAAVIQNPDDDGRGTQFWRTVDDRLRAAGVTRQQVQAVWMKHADAGPSEGFPAYAKKLEGEQLKIVQIVRDRFPNVKLAYLSSRTYGGYATTSLNPEPYAYESGFAVKWLIERQLAGDPELNFDPAKGPVKAPWLSWGPYLWANGATPRADGFSYERDDFGGDGTHHAQAGQRKCGKLIFDFFNSDSTTKTWFKASSARQ
ncbi:MAG TPA: hypothetical protein PLV92_21685, partial [Pirellulaceae bacterium]|nr:hypothetical protein [Pirellulaceae bacterium]